jgi:putative membrane protein
MYGLYNDYGYGGWGVGNMMGGFGGGIMMIAFWVLFIALIMWVVREVSGRNGNGNSNSKALDILKERYVKGEINKEEFESKKKDLTP